MEGAEEAAIGDVGGAAGRVVPHVVDVAEARTGRAAGEGAATVPDGHGASHPAGPALLFLADR